MNGTLQNLRSGSKAPSSTFCSQRLLPSLSLLCSWTRVCNPGGRRGRQLLEKNSLGINLSKHVACYCWRTSVAIAKLYMCLKINCVRIWTYSPHSEVAGRNFSSRLTPNRAEPTASEGQADSSLSWCVPGTYLLHSQRSCKSSFSFQPKC